jgi:hippurate hydrolase
LAAERLRKAGYEVTTGLGKTGVVGLLRNGEGPTVMLRADMDALPIAEATGLAYASNVTATDAEGNTVPVGHMCGHDMHVAWLVGAATLLSQARDAWKGILMVVFQPGEETAQGAQAMIDDGLLKRFPTPDVVLGQHVMVGPAGTVAGSAGPITSAADSLQIRLFGRGAHGSMPQASIDPVVMAAQAILALQTIRSRNLSALEPSVLTVGIVRGGERFNIIPGEVLLEGTVRTYNSEVRDTVERRMREILDGITRAGGGSYEMEYKRNAPATLKGISRAFAGGSSAKASSCSRVPAATI